MFKREFEKIKSAPGREALLIFIWIDYFAGAT